MENQVLILTATRSMRCLVRCVLQILLMVVTSAQNTTHLCQIVVNSCEVARILVETSVQDQQEGEPMDGISMAPMPTGMVDTKLDTNSIADIQVSLLVVCRHRRIATTQ